MNRSRLQADRPLRQLQVLAAFLLVAPASLAGYALPRTLQGPAGRLYSALFLGYLRLFARLGAALASVIDPAARAIDCEIRGRASVMIGSGYDAMDVILPVVAAVLVFPATLRSRSVGMAACILSLSALNLLRIGSLYWLALEGTASLRLASLEVFRVLMVTLAIVGFVAWARWARHEAPLTGYVAPEIASTSRRVTGRTS